MSKAGGDTVTKESSRSRYGAQAGTAPLDRGLDNLRKLLRRSNSSALGAVTRKIDRLASLTRPKRNYLPLGMRALISISQPQDPLRRAKELPHIDLVVPFVEKDLRSLPLALAHATRNVRNPLARIILITPRGSEGNEPRFTRDESAGILSLLLNTDPRIELRFDQDILGAPLLAELDERFGRGDRNAGWVTQQLIKLSAALQSTASASLILDADTLLLTPKTWLRSDQAQLLQVANEYHSSFMHHVKKFFGVPKKLRLSFVTHHQLMQREVVEKMFPDGSHSLLTWWKSSTDPIGRDLGDYEAYGSFLAHHYPERVVYGSFANLFSPHLSRFLRDTASSGKESHELIPDYCSVSFHSWAQVDRTEFGN